MSACYTYTRKVEYNTATISFAKIVGVHCVSCKYLFLFAKVPLINPQTPSLLVDRIYIG